MQHFPGEHIWPGYLGQLAIILTFVSALLAAYSFRRSVSTLELDRSWYKLGRYSFGIHLAAVVAAFAILFYIIFSHYFEYFYAWRHSSTGLQVKYIFSSFWEGSEGSFMLWIFWQAIFGLYICTRPAQQLHARAMTVVALVQASLATMLLGYYFGPDIKIGSNPFILLRHQMSDAPVFSQPDYLSKVLDGNGLNPLLQNYWMTIHPPVLFAGFALTLFPFAYTIAGLWQRDFKTFVKPVLRWTLLASAILGLGIMMGGAWAYESLSFGGYWAWDPVENASLVPWLILIAGLHTIVIYKSTGRSLRISLIFSVLSFVFVWYSTFLTRTGILGDTSVHAFTDAGKALFYHLIIVLVLIIIPSAWLMIHQWRRLPRIAGEEELDSREFWMLIGSMILLISSMLIIFYTSLPVWSPLWKMISGSDAAPPEDQIAFYNRIQVWPAILVALFSGGVQFLKYKRSNLATVWKRLGLSAAIAALLSIAFVWSESIASIPVIILSFAAIFALVANIHYLIVVQKVKLKKAAAVVTHFAFGMMLVAIIMSSYKKEVISRDLTGSVYDFGKETYQENLKESRENVLIFRNTTIPIGEYMVTYLGDSLVANDPPITYYKVKFERRNRETNEVESSFMLYPDAFVNANGNKGLSANPDAKHFFSHDLFVYLSSTNDPDAPDETEALKKSTLSIGDTLFIANGYLVYDSLGKHITNQGYKPEAGQVAAQASFSVYDINGRIGGLNPLFIISGQDIISPLDSLSDLGILGRVDMIHPENATIDFSMRQKSQTGDYVVLKVLVFPYIGMLWLSIIIMTIGFLMAFYARLRS